MVQDDHSSPPQTASSIRPLILASTDNDQLQPVRHLRDRPSFFDEVLPSPSSSLHTLHSRKNPSTHALRRSASLAIISIFLLAVIFMACTEQDTNKKVAADLRKVFGMESVTDLEATVGSLGSGSHEQDAEVSSNGEAAPNDSRPDIDFDQYSTLGIINEDGYDLSPGHRLIFIGDIHGSYHPFQRLLSKISYSVEKDTLVHVGDLVVRGLKNEDILWWMNDRNIKGVRGNHDQAVIQWRTWMQWAGGADWEVWVDSMGEKEEEQVLDVLGKVKKQFPNEWKWKSKHWKVAREISSPSYHYLLSLPLVLHFPGLHSFVVHAGLLPSNPLKLSSDNSQPLVQFSNQSTISPSSTSSRKQEELAFLQVPQNKLPWNLINMRSVFTKGKKKGEVTSSSKDGTPWSEVWNKEMSHCTGSGAWTTEGRQERRLEEEQEDNMKLEQQGSGAPTSDKRTRRQNTGASSAEKRESKSDSMDCSPVTIVYGHAAGRGLDIKPWTKGIDTGCVYGRQLTVLVLGDLSRLKGQSVRVGDHEGLLVSVGCGAKGT
ncbi:uncharacterized protein L203_102216 [Cryptococcus depauperatus CBS 7841]|uniref:Calcineurin-like phosphoesterase domain-containing protein n=1 Tax=Cryptococcus depauperatus CBS 7841 TaxID=1295531 RepID=A0AAJ8LZF6_9TREE